MYYEEAIVKTYYRNYENNKKVPFNQVYLGNAEDSEFNKNPEEPDKVGIIKLIDLKELLQKVEEAELNETEDKYKQLQEENNKLKQEIEELNSTAKSLASDVHKLTEEKIQLQEEKTKLQEDLLTEKDKHEKLIEIEKYEAKVEELSKEKDLTKSLLLVRSDFLKQNALKRLFKVEPESSKIIGNIKGLPEVEVEAKPSEDNE